MQRAMLVEDVVPAPSKPKSRAARTIEILPKPEYPDPVAARALRVLKSIGFLSARDVRSSRLIDFGEGLGADAVMESSRRFFLDPVTHDLRLIDPEPGWGEGAFDRWRAEIWPHPEFDDAGLAVREMLSRAGCLVPSVRVGRGFHIFAKYPKTQIENALCRALVDAGSESLVVVPDLG